MKFLAKQIHTYFEDEVQTVAFADSDNADPNVYLILQRGNVNDELYYFELNGRETSGEGGFCSAELTLNNFIIQASESLQQKMAIFNGEIEIILHQIKDKQLIELNVALVKIFVNSDCEFINDAMG
jgi:hypothetical protein